MHRKTDRTTERQKERKKERKTNIKKKRNNVSQKEIQRKNKNT